jgi:hypothetical protein
MEDVIYMGASNFEKLGNGELGHPGESHHRDTPVLGAEQGASIPQLGGPAPALFENGTIVSNR